MQKSLFIIGAILLLLSTKQIVAQPKGYQDWMLGPFERFNHNQPIIKPNSTTTFINPITHQTVRWQSKATFNPAAIVFLDFF